MVLHVEKLLRHCMPYRILRSAAAIWGSLPHDYDFEYTALPEKWLEVSSVSNFESFRQRMKSV